LILRASKKVNGGRAAAVDDAIFKLVDCALSFIVLIETCGHLMRRASGLAIGKKSSGTRWAYRDFFEGFDRSKLQRASLPRGATTAAADRSSGKNFWSNFRVVGPRVSNIVRTSHAPCGPAHNPEKFRSQIARSALPIGLE
jgi:hypothetical protein